MKSRKTFNVAGTTFALALCGLAAAPGAWAQQEAGTTSPDAGFQSMDKNHDGRLMRSEISSDMTLLRTRFSTYDANQDGSLDPQEYAAAKAAIQGSGNAMGSDAPASQRAPEQQTHPQQQPQQPQPQPSGG